MTDQFEARQQLAVERLQQQAEAARMRGDLAGQQAALAQLRMEILRNEQETGKRMTPYQVEVLAREHADSLVPVDTLGRRDETKWNKIYTDKKNELSAGGSGTSGLFR